ncbi:ABC-three component system protein [Pseudomonas aeruginosa]
MSGEGFENNHPHTAIPIWGGYVYQGKIALYCCLNAILEKGKECADLTLQLDSIDDFSILSDVGVVSLHQVKAYKSEYFSAYSGAVEGQILKAKEHPGSKAYFHVSRSVNLPLDYAEKFGSVQFYKYKVGGAEQDFCALNEVDELLELQVADFYKHLHGVQVYTGSKDHLCLIRGLLEDVIVKRVMKMHATIQDSVGVLQRITAFNELIGFSEFFEILEKEIIDDLLDENFFGMEIKKNIGVYFSEFCEECDLDHDDICKLDRYLAKINLLDVNELKDFILSVAPDKKAKFGSIREYKDETINSDGMKMGLFRLFSELIEATYNSDVRGARFSWADGGVSYFPTSISSGPSNAASICKKIVDGAVKYDVDFLYESGLLITTDIDVESIYSVAVGVRSLIDQSHDKFNKFKKVGLVSLSKIPGGIRK